MRVLLVLVSNGQCSLGNAASHMQLHSALCDAPDVHVTIHVAASMREAVEAALKGSEAGEAFDALVAVKGHIAFPVSFVLRGLVAPFPFVVGVHPLPRLNWERIAAKATDPTRAEELRFAGNTYNVDPARAKVLPNGYMEVGAVEEIGAAVLKREALLAVAASSEHDLCKAWGKEVHADMESPCASTGALEFVGCVGARAVLR